MERWLKRASDCLCRVGWHCWQSYVTYTGSGSRTCTNCDRREFFFGGKWCPVPQDEREDGYGG